MMVVFVRHGERRRADVDPGLTSAGRRMAFETGQWIGAQAWGTVTFLTTPTTRTRQTTAELRMALDSDAPVLECAMPEQEAELDLWLRGLLNAAPAADVLVCVGHHPTIELLQCRYPPPVCIPRGNFACAMALRVHNETDMTCVASWPGRPSF